MVFRPPFFVLMAGSIVLAVLGAYDPAAFSFIWPYNVLVLALAVLLYLLTPSGASISVVRKFDPVLSVRVSNLVRILVTNEGDQPMSFCLREEPSDGFLVDTREFNLTLDPGERKELRYHVIPLDRGDYFFRDSFIRVRSIAGIVDRQSKIPTREIVRVYPNVLALRQFDLLKQRGHLRQIGIRRSRLKGVGTDFESLRDYVQDDDYRKVEWKASARKNKLVVKEFEAERNQPVILIIDTGRLMMADVGAREKLDHVLDSSLMLCNAAATASDHVGLLLYSDRVDRWIAPRRGRGQVGQIIEAIHALRAQPIEPDAKSAFAFLAARWKRRALIVIFTEIETQFAAREMLATLGPLARRHLCLVVTVSDPEVRTMAAASADGHQSLFERAAAVMFQEERVSAQLLLNRAGVRTLDAEPEELGAALVNYYLSVKATAQI